MRGDPNGKETYWRGKYCNTDGTSFYTDWMLGSTTCVSDAATPGTNCATSSNFTGLTMLSYVAFGSGGSSSLPCFSGSVSGTGVGVAYTKGATNDQVSFSPSFAATETVSAKLLTPQGAQTATLGGGCVMTVTPSPGPGWNGSTGSFAYNIAIEHPASNQIEQHSVNIDVSALTSGAYQICSSL